MNVRELITLVEHKSSSYAPRTYVNAAAGDVTLVVAVDHTTAGEKCTRKAVGDDYKLFAITPRERDKLSCSRLLFAKLRKLNAKVLNIAGNGISTFAKHGATQQAVNQYVYDLLKPVAEHWKLEKIVSGGQTGTDMAGAVAAAALGIPAVLTFPKGFKQRFEDGVDVLMDEDAIYRQIEEGVAALKHVRHAPVGTKVTTDYSGKVTQHEIVERTYGISQSGVMIRVIPVIPKSMGDFVDSDWFELA